MTPRPNNSRKMTWFNSKLKMLPGSNTSNKKVSVVVLALVLLSNETRCDPLSASGECCRQPSRACRLHLFLCRSGGVSGGPADPSAGILTLGKRMEDEGTFNNRLHQLLYGSRSHAAGILTMGRRAQNLWGVPSNATPSPV
ncbi:hypocretin neuropeptide precursor isoform X2 [Hippocampus comes]|uniref:Hypocretin neuropeptide precursor n=1 Tax=Hippocampus comes TaxID=109280 RepID=A0A3Q2YQ70_HIPCM|nr:PREDICTED: orexin isoform X2 [Hippocampus comes]